MGARVESSGQRRAQWLRRWGLTVWFTTFVGVQVLTFPFLSAHPPALAWSPELLRLLPWLGGVGLGMGSLFVLEGVGPRVLAPADPDLGAHLLGDFGPRLWGYSWARRTRWLFDATLCWFVAGVTTIVGSSLLGHALAEAASVPALFDGWPPLLRLLVAFLLMDVHSYFRHRLEHAGGERSWMWRRVHRYHHEPVVMDLWAGMQVHWLEALLVFGPPCLLLSALGFATWELLFLFTLFLLITATQHVGSGWTSGPIMGPIFQGPDAHLRHHSVVQRDRLENLADCLTLWDRLFGTWAPPRPGFRGPYGPGDSGPGSDAG